MPTDDPEKPALFRPPRCPLIAHRPLPVGVANWEVTTARDKPHHLAATRLTWRMSVGRLQVVGKSDVSAASARSVLAYRRVTRSPAPVHRCTDPRRKCAGSYVGIRYLGEPFRGRTPERRRRCTRR